MYDFLIVGSGLYGAVCAYELNKKGYKVAVIEKREHIGGNIYTESVGGIDVHKYGAHIFHTNNKFIWDYVNQIVPFNNFINSPLANYQNKLYNLPFNMNTFYQLWGCKTPEEAKTVIEHQKSELNIQNPQNLEEQALSLVGSDIYYKFIKGYTEKQWGRSASELPSFIIKRIPVRFTFNNNYFNDKYQGIPVGGYTALINKLLDGIDVKLNTDYLKDKKHFNQLARNIIYTGQIDAYYDYQFGSLAYRSLKFESETIPMENYQGNAVVNYTDESIPYTRIIEHKHFNYVDTPNTIITKEYPADWNIGDEAYYPINDPLNNEIYKSYKSLAENEPNIYFGGRLADYCYYDMHIVIEKALEFIREKL